MQLRTNADGGEKERYEAYRELGTALHTLEDFLAHSNYLELALNKLGNRQVFCHVGDNVRIRAPNGQNVPPLCVTVFHLSSLANSLLSVTGTFGSSDFILSLIGEAGDKLSSSTVDDLNSKFQNAQQQQNSGNDGIGMLKTLLGKIPSSNKNEGEVDNKLQNVEEIRKNAINIDPCVILDLRFRQSEAKHTFKVTASLQPKYRRSSWTFSRLEIVSSRASKEHLKLSVWTTSSKSCQMRSLSSCLLLSNLM